MGGRSTITKAGSGGASPSESVSTGALERTTYSSDSDLDSDSYSDPDTDYDVLSDTDTEASTPKDSNTSSHEVEVSSETREILGDIARFREEGPAKPRHTPQTTRLWKVESGYWEKYCGKIREQTGLCAENLLRTCDPSVFKSYLFWRRKTSRIKKESAIEAYWKRICMYYRDVTDHAMGNEVLKDVRNWIPSLGLDRSKKEKLAMFVQDLYAILHALWVDDTKPLHGFIRIQISLLLLLSAATATRPGALVESASNKGSNKALYFKDVQLMKVRSLEDPNRSTIVVNVNLEHVKNKEKDGTPKKFTFRLEGLPALCIVLHILGIGSGRNAFRDNFTSTQQIFDLVIPAERNVLRIRWKKEVLDQPFFCDVITTTEGARILKDKAFPYAKYRSIFIWLGRVAGIEAALELYQLRRASGHNINRAFTTAERNQTMGHVGGTYEKYYTPTHIARDFQAIYFGTPSEEELIQSVARMGLSRDRRAPIELNDNQQKEVRNDPMLIALRQKRERYKQKLRDQGFYPLSDAKGTHVHDKYEKTNKKIASTYQQLHRIRLDEAIRAFHDSIDTIEIARQLSGKPATEVLTLPTVEFELRERSIIAAMLFNTIETDRARVRFVRALARLCWLQETRRPKASKRTEIDSIVLQSPGTCHPRKRKRSADEADECLKIQHANRVVKQKLNTPKCRDVVEIDSQLLYPLVPPHPVCGFCMGNEMFTYEQRMKPWPRKDVRNKHVDTHFRNPKYQKEFQCPYPNCFSTLDDKMHFKRHSLDVHKVSH